MNDPHYTHDCEGCTHLGDIDVDGTVYDLYFCPQGYTPTVIARFSSNGPDYVSGLIFAQKGYEPLATALARATEQGLYNPTPRLDPEKYIRRDHTDEQKEMIRNWARTLPTLTEGEYLKEAAQYIWFSTFAHNNPRSEYHGMAALCYDEAGARGDTDLYQRAWNAAEDRG